jgi:hypothetical protein
MKNIHEPFVGGVKNEEVVNVNGSSTCRWYGKRCPVGD